MKFIQLTEYYSDPAPMWINTAHIVQFFEDTGGGTNLHLTDREEVVLVKEPIHRVIELLGM